MKAEDKRISCNEFYKKKSKNSLNSKIKQVLTEMNSMEVIKALSRKESQLKLLPSNNSIKNKTLSKITEPNSYNNRNDQESHRAEDLLEKIQQYNIDYKINIDDYKDKKEENDEFINKYNKLKKINEENETVSKIKGHEATFQELIFKYKQKGYKIPNLSVKNNIFNPSPLLMESSKLVEYYKMHDEEFDAPKNILFLKNLTQLVVERTVSDEDTMAKLQRKNIIKNISKDKFQMINEKIMTEEELELDIRKNEEDLKMARQYLQDSKILNDSPKIKYGTEMNFKSENLFNSKFETEENKRKSKLFIQDVTRLKEFTPKNNKAVRRFSYVNNNKYNKSSLKTSAGSDQISYSINELVRINELPNHNAKLQSSETLFIPKLPFRSKLSGFLKQTPNKKITLGHNEATSSSQQSFFNEMNVLSTNANSNPKQTFSRLFTYTNSTTNSYMNTLNPKLELETLYEKAAKKDQKYLRDTKEMRGTIYGEIEDYLNINKKYEIQMDSKKLQPRHLMNNISDIKHKVDMKDVYSSFIGISDKVAKHKINIDGLSKVKELDNLIKRFDKKLIRSLNSGVKESDI